MILFYQCIFWHILYILVHKSLLRCNFGVMFRYFRYFFIASYLVVWSSNSSFGATFLSCQQSKKHVEEACFGLCGSISPNFVQFRFRKSFKAKKKHDSYFVKLVVSFLHHAEDEGNFFQLPFIGRQQGGWDLRGCRNESLNHLCDLKYIEVLR